ncbi:MAG: lasso RiPP family leader peptide-containing protein [Chloroflexi bacterium]|nr:lasso RiPP family leader peptide-containing protein [Chloroflexota bacterium]
MNNNTQLPKIKNPAKPRKPYRKPKLESLGDLRSLTLGGSFGTGESGGTSRKVKLNLPIGVVGPDGSTLLPDGSILPPDQQP